MKGECNYQDSGSAKATIKILELFILVVDSSKFHNQRDPRSVLPICTHGKTRFEASISRTSASIHVLLAEE